MSWETYQQVGHNPLAGMGVLFCAGASKWTLHCRCRKPYAEMIQHLLDL
jgi:hypothetical protein